MKLRTLAWLLELLIVFDKQDAIFTFFYVNGYGIMSQNNQKKAVNKKGMAVKYGALGALLAVAPVMLVTEILMPMLSV